MKEEEAENSEHRMAFGVPSAFYFIITTTFLDQFKLGGTEGQRSYVICLLTWLVSSRPRLTPEQSTIHVLPMCT